MMTCKEGLRIRLEVRSVASGTKLYQNDSTGPVIPSESRLLMRESGESA